MAAPTAPTIGSPTVTTSDEHEIPWTDESDNEDGFRVFESTDGGKNWTNISGDLAANTTSYTTGVRDSLQLYVYYVEAFNADGTSQSGEAVAHLANYASGDGMDTTLEMLDETPSAAVSDGAGSGTASALPPYFGNEVMGPTARFGPTVPSTDVEEGTGQDVQMQFSAALANEDMPTTSSFTAGATVGSGSDKKQGVPLVSYDDTSPLSVSQDIQGAGEDFPVTVAQSIVLNFNDVTKLASFDASIYTECDAEVSIASLKTKQATNEVEITLEAEYTCPDSDATLQVEPTAKEGETLNVTSTEVQDTQVTSGGDSVSASSGGWEWDSEYEYPSTTLPPRLSLGGGCMPADTTVTVPLQLHYSGEAADPVYGYECKIDYDPTVLDLAGVDAVDSTGAFAAPNIEYHDADAGVLKLNTSNGAGYEPWDSDHPNTLAELRFTPVGTNGEASRVSFVETYDDTYQSDSPYRGQRPADVWTEDGATVDWELPTTTAKDDWRPFRFSNGSVSLGNGINLSNATTTYDGRVAIEVSVDAGTDVAGYDLDFGYPGPDTDVPFAFDGVDAGAISDPSYTDYPTDGMVTVSASEASAGNSYTDPLLCTLYFKPKDPQGGSNSFNVRWIGGELWDVNNATIAVDCTTPSEVHVSNSVQSEPVGEEIHVPEGEVTSSSSTAEWPLVLNQTYTVDNITTNGLDEMKVEVTSTTNPEATLEVNSVETTPRGATANCTITIPKADPQEYPIKFTPHIWFVWGNGKVVSFGGLNVGGTVHQGTHKVKGRVRGFGFGRVFRG